MTHKSINKNTMKRSTFSFLLLMFVIMGDQLIVSAYGRGPAPQMQQQQMRFRPRYPRRDPSYLAAYNIHKTFKARDVNDLDAQQARKAMVDVQQTIAEVQRLLAQDPSLPRLTRGEIEELFENVTREELAKSLREGDQTRASHMRALMLVLPYHTNNMSPENLQNMYTLPPVTKVVPNEIALKKNPANIPTREPSRMPLTKMTVTTMRPTFRQRTPVEELRRPSQTTPVPITTIRFTTPKPTTFHPALPNAIRDEVKPSQTKPRITTTSEAPVELTTLPIEPVSVDAPVRVELPIATTEVIKNSEINDILASLGLGDGVLPTFRPLPAEMTTPFELTTEFNVPQQTEDPEKSDEELKMLLRSFGLLNDGGNSVGINPIPVDPLYPETLSDVQPSHLIQNEGLKVEELEPSAPAMTKPDIKPDDYVAFKPLPSDVPQLNEDLDQLLKSFGILDNSERKEKSIKTESTTSAASVGTTEMEELPMIDKDLVVPQMASILDNLGIQTMKKDRNGRKLDMKKETTGVELKSNGVAFRPKKKLEKPEKPEKVVNEDYRKLEQLWETIRELEKLNPNITEESLESLNLKNFNLSESLLAQGPNPLESYDYTRINDIKKRQQPTTEDTPTRISLDLDITSNSSTGNTSSNQVEIISTTTGDQPRSTVLDVDADAPSSTTTTTTSTSTTTTESSSSSSSISIDSSARFTALEESFGGGADPVAQEPLPAPRRNGFYFLADWNSFLEVGEDPNKVVISFRPQAGDPSRFLPVNVP